MARNWTAQEKEDLLKIHDLYTTKELAEMFNTSVEGIYRQKRRLGISKKHLEEKLPEGMRRCKECQEVFPLNDDYFYLRNKRYPNGARRHICIECAKISMAKYRRNKKLQENV